MKTAIAAAAIAAMTVLAAQAQQGDVARGKAAYMDNMCHTCHGTAGQGGDRGSGPRIAYDVWPWEAFAQQVRRPREVMPRYDRAHLADADLADIYAYVASMKRGARAKDIPLLKD